MDLVFFVFVVKLNVRLTRKVKRKKVTRQRRLLKSLSKNQPPPIVGHMTDTMKMSKRLSRVQSLSIPMVMTFATRMDHLDPDEEDVTGKIILREQKRDNFLSKFPFQL